MARSRYDQFYNSKFGSGLGDIGPVFKRNYYQQGNGLSSVFSGLLKLISPYLISGAKAVGKEALKGSANILSNLDSQPFSELVKGQAKKSFQNLMDKAEQKMNSSGKGIKRRRRVTSTVSPKAKRRRTVRRPKKIGLRRSPQKKARKVIKRKGGIKKRRVNRKSRKTLLSKSDFLAKYLP